MLRLQMGDVWLPLAINTYTGGIADWPGRILSYVGLAPVDGRWLYSCWSGLLCIFVFRFFKKTVGCKMAFWTGISLALSWDLMLFRVALAGTEQMLYSAWTFTLLLFLTSHKLRQWCLVTALGFHAKLTFGLSLAPMLLLSKGPKKTKRLLYSIAVGVIALLPMFLVIKNAKIPSHDTLNLQYERVLLAFQGGDTSTRETWTNLWHWLMNPSDFWAQLYKLPPINNYGIRPICILVFFILAAVAWKHKSHFSQKFRELTLIMLGQAILLSWIAKDIHHFGVLSITLSIWVALLANQIFSMSNKKYHLLIKAVLLIWPIGLVLDLIKTPEQFRHLKYHGMSMQNQRLACETLIRNDVKKVMTLDYDIYGVFEALCPQVSVTHGWGMLAQHRAAVLDGLLEQANGGHLLIFPDSQPWSYNLKPSLEQLNAAHPNAKITLLESEPFQLYSITIEQ